MTKSVGKMFFFLISFEMIFYTMRKPGENNALKKKRRRRMPNERPGPSTENNVTLKRK